MKNLKNSFIALLAAFAVSCGDPELPVELFPEMEYGAYARKMSQSGEYNYYEVASSKVDLSVEGNRMPLITEDQYNNDKNFHLKGNSFFANNRGKDFKVIDSVETNSVNIFAGISGNEIIIESGEPDDVASTFVGTSGFGTFYYYEDTLEFDEDIQVDETFNSTVNPIFTNPY